VFQPPQDPTVMAALLLVNSGPAAWQGLLAAHVSDRSGHCSGCSSTAAGAPVWPCTLRAIAEIAQQLATAADRRSRH